MIKAKGRNMNEILVSIMKTANKGSSVMTQTARLLIVINATILNLIRS